MAEGEAPETVQSEIARLRQKQEAISDEDIRLALQARIDALEKSLLTESVAATPSDVDEELPDAPSPTDLETAERLIRQSKVERMRKNRAASTALLKQAASIAPGAPAVLEALADDLAERKQWKEAEKSYAQAVKLDPTNVGLERKHAHSVLRKASTLTVEDALRAGLSDSPLLTQGDAVASLSSARLLNAVLPGVGHMVLGRTTAGVSFLVCWLACLVWLAVSRKDIQGLILLASGKSAQPGLLVLVPLLLAFIIYFSALLSLGKEPSGTRSKVRVERPVPPVDLPFE